MSGASIAQLVEMHQGEGSHVELAQLDTLLQGDTPASLPSLCRNIEFSSLMDRAHGCSDILLFLPS